MNKSGMLAGLVALALVIPAVPANADDGDNLEGRACRPQLTITLVSDTSIRVDVKSPGFFGSDTDETPQSEPSPDATPTPTPTPTPIPADEPSDDPSDDVTPTPTPADEPSDDPSDDIGGNLSDRAASMVTVCPRVAVDVEVINVSTGQVLDEFRKWRPWLVFKGGWSTTVSVAAGQTVEASATYSGSTVTKRITAPSVPDSPRNVITTDLEPTSVTLQWSPPHSDGGKPITAYEVTWVDQRRLVSGTSITISDLTFDTSYTMAVAAVNSLGKSIAIPLTFKTPPPPSAPSAPRNLTFLTLSNPSQLGLDWVAPESDGGSPIDGYLVSWQGGSVTDEAFVTDTSAVISNLKRGTRYTFEIKARNAVGFSPSVTGRKITILDPAPRPDVPTVPLNVQITNVSHTQLSVAWEPPATDGGSPITGYLVDWGSGSKITKGTTTTVDGLTPAARVTVSISAINAFGSSPAAKVTTTTPIRPVPRPTVPTAPQNLKSISLNEFILVSFDPPVSDGGAAILYYEATDKSGRSSQIQIELTPSGVHFATMGPYNPGEIHDIDIVAINSMGAGPAASIQGKTNLVPVPAPTVPGLPENLEVVNTESDSISLVWDAPEDTGGSRITGYKVTWGTSESLLVPVPSVVIEGLQPGTFYTVEVHAINQMGVGAPASLEVLTNMAPVPIPERPSVPRNVKVTGVTGTSIAIDWEVPVSDGGTPITGYEVVNSGGIGQVVPETTVLLQGLQPNRAYSITINAINQMGDSETVTVTARTAAVPPGPGPAPAPQPFTPATNGGNADGSLDVDSNPLSVQQTAPGEWPVNPKAKSGRAKPIEKEPLFLTNADQMAQLDITFTSPSIKRAVVSINPKTDTYVLVAELKKGKVSGAVTLTVEAPSITRDGVTYEPLQSSKRFIIRR